MRDEDGQVTIDGFYNDVRSIAHLGREPLNVMPFGIKETRSDPDINRFAEGLGDSYLWELLYYPTLNIAGFTSGYSGEDIKTIIPPTAKLKIDIRLVANQDYEDIYEKSRGHVADHATGTVDIEVSKVGAMSTQRTSVNHPIREPALDATAKGWNVDPETDARQVISDRRVRPSLGEASRRPLRQQRREQLLPG